MKRGTRLNMGRPVRRRAAVVVQVAVFSGVMVGFAALAIDLGRLYTARGELQRAADSAALAGVSAYFTNAGLLRQNGELENLATERASSVAVQNPTLGADTMLEAADLTVGTLDLDAPHTVLESSGVHRFNAVQVLLRRAPGTSNGPVNYLFAHIFGLHEGSVVAGATAVIDDRFSGYHETEVNRLLVPFAVDRDQYAQIFAGGPDEWSFEDDVIYHAEDGVPEVRLFPWKLCGKGGGSSGAGNFGILNVGTGHGVPFVEEQIRFGITPDQLISEIGTSEVTFYNSEGNRLEYDVGGTPGMKAGMEDALEERLGELVGFFLYDSYTGSGANLTYRIVDIRFGRVMNVDLHGSPDNKQLVIQPVAYTGPGVIVNEYADSSDGAAGLARLVR